MKEVINTYYLPLKRLSKKDLKFQAKPWITNGIRSSIKRRDKLLRKFIKTKDEVLKHELYATYKTLGNKIVSLTRASKKLHFQKYFTENYKDIRKTWSGINNVIKNVINIRNFNKGQPTSILIDGEISNDPNKIANGFNNYFSNFFLFQSADSQEILLIIDSFDNNKSSGPNSIPTDVLKLIKNNIICHPLIKYLRELSTKGYILFLTNTIVYMNFNLVFEPNILPTMLCLASLKR